MVGSATLTTVASRDTSADPSTVRDQHRAPGTAVEAETLLRVGDDASPAPIAAPRRAVTPPAYVRPMSLSAQFVPYGRPGAVRLQALLAELPRRRCPGPGHGRGPPVVGRALALRRSSRRAPCRPRRAPQGWPTCASPRSTTSPRSSAGRCCRPGGAPPSPPQPSRPPPGPRCAPNRACWRRSPSTPPPKRPSPTAGRRLPRGHPGRPPHPGRARPAPGRRRPPHGRCRLSPGRQLRRRDAAAAAVEALGRDGTLLAGTGPVVVHLPSGLLPHHLALLRALGAVNTVVVQVGVTGDTSVDAEAHDLVRDLGATCTGIELRAAPAPPPPSPRPTPTPRSSRPCATSAARVAAGTPLDRIASPTARPRPTPPCCASAAPPRGCPSSGPPRAPSRQTLAGRAAPGRGRPARLGVAPRRRRGLVGHGPAAAPGSRGRRRRGRPAVAPGRRHRGRERWLSGLAALADELDRRREELPFDEGRGGRGTRPAGGPRP